MGLGHADWQVAPALSLQTGATGAGHLLPQLTPTQRDRPGFARLDHLVLARRHPAGRHKKYQAGRRLWPGPRPRPGRPFHHRPGRNRRPRRPRRRRRIPGRWPCTASSSSGLSVPKRLMATTQGRPNPLTMPMWCSRLAPASGYRFRVGSGQIATVGMPPCHLRARTEATSTGAAGMQSRSGGS